MNFIAYAQSTGAAPTGQGLLQIVPFILIFAVFYLLVMRPQQKKEKERKALIASVQKGDKVVSIGGIHGVVTNIKEDDVVVVKVDTNTKLEFLRSAIQTKVVPKTAEEKAKEKKKEKK